GMLPHMLGDESRYELRAKIAGELRRLIEQATAIGNELVVVLKGTRLYRVELFFKRSILKELRLVSIHGGFAYVFPRDKMIGDPDLAGLFAGYLLTEHRHQAA